MVTVTVKQITTAASDEELLVALANTGHDGTDELTDPQTFSAWWAAQPFAADAVAGRPASRAGLDAVRATRRLVRDLALRHNGVEVRPEAGALGLLPLRVVVEAEPGLAADAPDLASEVAGRAALALLRASARPGWSRLRACPGPDCEWVFVDRSRNGSRRWCQMSECGNRAKAAAFRARSAR